MALDKDDQHTYESPKHLMMIIRIPMNANWFEEDDQNTQEFMYNECKEALLILKTRTPDGSY